MRTVLTIEEHGLETAGRYREALASFDTALEVFDAGGLEWHRAGCRSNRARVGEKLSRS